MIKHWATLKYHDPGEVLRKLRAAEIELSSVELDPRVRRLRTNQLKKYREWRDAALFTYGLTVAHGDVVRYATEEKDDYDFVAFWVEGDTKHFTPVQLKEWVPEELNPNASLEEVLAGSARSASPTETVLAVRLNRRTFVDLEKLTLPKLPWAEVWFFWASSPDGNQWSIWGDALSKPTRTDFEYPT